MDSAIRIFQNLRFRIGGDPRLPQSQRKKIVLLGTGWAAMNFLRRVDVAKYEVSIISPRNYFTFTPLLPSVCSGTLSARTCLEPVRNKLFRGGKKVMEFYEAWATELNTLNKSVVCKSKTGYQFALPYDYLIVAVGAEISTFGIPGVAENSHFLKEVENAKAIRKKVFDNFEAAALPGISDEKRKKLLHFVVVGGGPTGVESAAEFSDFIRDDVSKHFPYLLPFIKVTLVEFLPKILPTFSNQVSEFSLQNLRKSGVDTKLQCKVIEMSNDSLTLMDNSNQKHVLPCSFVLWAAGVGQVPFSKSLLNQIPEQKDNRILRVNERLQLIGGQPSLYGMGDCCYFTPEPVEKHINRLYDEAFKSPTGPGTTWLKSSASRLSKEFSQFSPLPACLDVPSPQDHLDKNEFTELIKKIDLSYKTPPPTAQAANQAGIYLASVFNKNFSDERKSTAPPFHYRWKGFMAYVGMNQSVIDAPFGSILGGWYSRLMWRSFYWHNQMSINNKLSCSFDWTKLALRGRDMGRDHSEGTLPKHPTLK